MRTARRRLLRQQRISAPSHVKNKSRINAARVTWYSIGQRTRTTSPIQPRNHARLVKCRLLSESFIHSAHARECQLDRASLMKFFRIALRTPQGYRVGTQPRPGMNSRLPLLDLHAVASIKVASSETISKSRIIVQQCNPHCQRCKPRASSSEQGCYDRRFPVTERPIAAR